jgi:NAD(P)-dependent dehydrogenase (short-subunit alcohol dehydrogenase family)
MDSVPSASNPCVIYVTGAASGIGLACVKRFAADNLVVVGSDLLSTPPADYPASASYIPSIDVRDEDQQQAAVAQIVRDHARLDVLVTSAGVPGEKSGQIQTDTWGGGGGMGVRYSFSTNRLCRETVPLSTRYTRQWCSLLHVSSISYELTR